MNKKLVPRIGLVDRATRQIINLCFDPRSIDRFTPGLKLIFAAEDPPLFVMLEEVESEKPGKVMI